MNMHRHTCVHTHKHIRTHKHTHIHTRTHTSYTHAHTHDHTGSMGPPASDPGAIDYYPNGLKAAKEMAIKKNKQIMDQVCMCEDV